MDDCSAEANKVQVPGRRASAWSGSLSTKQPHGIWG